ncbi:hypothetical protein [Shewanella waksmanii]|uniref:hypothetical protein n=1 Tax=Shewanella waksmanii TaxID=213783 RepID=UPI003736FE98
MNTIIGGNINADGTLYSGNYVSVIKESTGIYEITFAEAFSKVPSILLTQNHPSWGDFSSKGGSTIDNCTIIAVDKTKVKVKTGNSSGEVSNRNFSILAIDSRETETDVGLVSGLVNADGTNVDDYPDFFTTKIDTGLYLITFSQPFSEPPVITVLQNYPEWDQFNSDGGSTHDNAVVVAVKKQQVLIKTGGGNGSASDRNFCFIACDPSFASTSTTRKMATGDINADGTIHSGDGFIAIHDDTGEYSCAFNSGTFSSSPAVIATQNYPGWSDFSSSGGSTEDNCTLIAINNTKCKIKTGGGNGSASDRNLSFVAMATLK